MLTADGVAATAASIACVQRADGAIPWFTDGPVDPWDHVESAMGLTISGGYQNEVRGAYRWLRRTQRADGSWPSRRVRGRVTDASGNANFVAYVAVGLLLDTLMTNDESLVGWMWATLDRAVEYALGLQAPGGQVYWARDDWGRPDPVALLTASSCVLLSLRCAVGIAELLGHDRPEWELAATRLATAITDTPDKFAPAGRHSMDWYWPVLGGAVRGDRARERLLGGWARYVVPGHGARCVDDAPWVTAAESAELVMALVSVGENERAHEIFDDLQHLRDPTGAYWTGAVWPQGTRWPVERTTWTSAAVLLANESLSDGAVMKQLVGVRDDLVIGDAVPAATP